MRYPVFQISQSQQFWKLPNFTNFKFLGIRFRISKIQYENWRNYEYCGMSNGRTKSKFANFWNQIMVFQIEKRISKIAQILQYRKLLNFHYRQTQKK